MTDLESSNSGKIRVADITLAQLSRGLYRSNATVFKELINNSYDADASEVRVNTNFPEFNYISIVDNGKGMTLESFIKHFSDEGIGSSGKRRGDFDYTEKFNRPIIGRLGIGMMAIGQLCHSFEIESHYYDENNKGQGFTGEIVLTDETIPDIESEIRKPESEGKEIDVGEWSYEKVDFDESKVGFRIFSSDVRGTFRREMRESYENVEDFKKLSFSLNNIISIIYGSRSVRDCKAYLETIWELCTLCPLPYFENDLSPVYFKNSSTFEIVNDEYHNFIADRQRKLIDYNFDLYFDGIQLRKLIQLPTDHSVSSRVYFFDFEKKIFETDLKFSGYIFAQVSKAIRPFELNGIQIRLRNVGIGGYDPTFLKYYRQVETVRSKWVSGEVFVDSGLEAALNIDRDSFNEHEEHYKAVQKFLHEKLDKVFDEVNKVASQNRKIQQESKLNEQSERIKNYVLEASDGKFSLEESEDIEGSIKVLEEERRVLVNNKFHEIRNSKADQLYKIIDIAYHISKNTISDEDERHLKFMNLVKRALKELL